MLIHLLSSLANRKVESNEEKQFRDVGFQFAAVRSVGDTTRLRESFQHFTGLSGPPSPVAPALKDVAAEGTETFVNFDRPPLALNFPESFVPIALFGRFLSLSSRKYINRGFGLFNLNQNDEVIISQVRPRDFVINALHGHKGAQCLVSCADGKTSENCITCEDSDVTVRLCC